MAVFVAWHIRFSAHSSREVGFIFSVALVGTAIDTLFAATDLIAYNGGYAGLPWLAPLWITAMWAGFSTTINHSLRWLGKNLGIAAIMGLIFGPLTYIGGEKLGALQLSNARWLAIGILATAWAVVIPAMYLTSRKLNLGQDDD